MATFNTEADRQELCHRMTALIEYVDRSADAGAGGVGVIAVSQETTRTLIQALKCVHETPVALGGLEKLP